MHQKTVALLGKENHFHFVFFFSVWVFKSWFYSYYSFCNANLSWFISFGKQKFYDEVASSLELLLIDAHAWSCFTKLYGATFDINGRMRISLINSLTVRARREWAVPSIIHCFRFLPQTKLSRHFSNLFKLVSRIFVWYVKGTMTVCSWQSKQRIQQFSLRKEFSNCNSKTMSTTR